MKYLQDPDCTIWQGDCLDVLSGLPDASAAACVTSPPYLDARPEYPSPSLVEFAGIFDELARVVTGPCLVNVGRIWRGGIERLWWTALLDAAAPTWKLLDTLVWIKPNANPIHGQVFANSHEYVLIFGREGCALNVDAIRRPHAESTVSRFDRAWTNHKGVKNLIPSKERKTRAEPNRAGARPRSYISLPVGREKGNEHPAPMALALAEHLVQLACLPGQTIIDPFGGSGTTAVAARKHGRSAIVIDLDRNYCAMAAKRLQQLSLLTGGAV